MWYPVSGSSPRARAADTGAAVSVDRAPARPGWLVVTVERSSKTRRLWVAEDEAAQLHAALGRQLAPVTITRRDERGVA